MAFLVHFNEEESEIIDRLLEMGIFKTKKEIFNKGVELLGKEHGITIK